MAIRLIHAMARRRLALGVFVVVLTSPSVRNVDSFPLSTQPMYANNRGPTARLATVIGRDITGAPRRLSMRIAAATDDPLIAQSRVARSTRSSRPDGLCRTVADRIPAKSPIVSIEVVWEEVDLVAMTQDPTSFGELEVAAQCLVETG